MENQTKLSARELAIAKIAWQQGYGSGHNDTVDGGYNTPDEYDYDQLMNAIQDGVFDDIPPNA